MLIPALVVCTQSSYTQLSEALAVATWNAESRGPLLAIDPARVRAPQPQALPLPIGVPEAVQAFDQQVIRCGSLSVVAPLYQPPPARPNSPVSQGSPLLLMLDLLSDRQLQSLGSERGLGLADLTSDNQRAIFQKLIPSPLSYWKATSTGNGYHAGGEATTLAPQEQASVRLRIRRRSTVAVLGAAEGARMRTSKDQGSLPYGTPFLALAETNRFQERPSSSPSALKLPNRLKPSALALDLPVLQASIALDGSTTVGELVARCQKATGIELHTDLAYRTLPVQLRVTPGTQVAASDVLKALCWSLQATLRQVDSAYLLVPDQEGQATKIARAERAQRESSRLVGDEREARRARLAKRDLASSFPFASDDLLGQDTALRQRVEGATPRREGVLTYRGLVLPLKEAPTALQQRVRAGLAGEEQRHQESERIQAEIAARITAQGGTPPRSFSQESPFTPELVQLAARYEPELLLPDGSPILLYGQIAEISAELAPSLIAGIFPSLSTDTPFVLEGKQGKASVVLVAPKMPAEASALVEQAVHQGFTKVWVEVDTDLAPLDAALIAGKQKGIAIGAALKLLRGSEPTLPRDLTPLGEDGTTWLKRLGDGWNSLYQDSPAAWLVPNDTATQAHLLVRLTELAKRPGLTSFICLDTTPPGYAEEKLSTSFEGNEFGYAPAVRLAFLRREGRDPLDIGNPFSSVGPPGMRTGQEINQQQKLRETWNTTRRTLRQEFLSAAYRQIRERLPQVPLYFCGTPLDWFGTWESAERIPERKTRVVSGDPADRIGPSQQAHQLSALALRPVLFRPGALNKARPQGARPAPLLPDGPAALAYTLRETLDNDSHQGTKPPDWDGLVIDLRFVAPNQIRDILAGVRVNSTP